MEIEFKNVIHQNYELNFNIDNKDITGITGRGKTTVLKLINGIILSEKGSILFNKNKLTKINSNEIRKKVSLIEQEFKKLLFIRTVEEYMEFIIKHYRLIIKDPNKKIRDSLKIVGLNENYLLKDIHILSKSELKLIQIATSLLSNPDVLLLDEPFIDLDTKNEKKIIMLLNKLKDNYNKTIVIASNDSDMLYKYTTKMIFLKNNKVLIEGNTKDQYKRVDFLTRNKIEIPDIVLFTYKACKYKNAKIDYHTDIRDIIKDIYKHV